nr:IS110 family transposase [Bradyrhizobium sp. 164]
MLFDVRAALFALPGKDLTQINGFGPYLALKLIAQCGDDLSAWPSAKHVTSWLCLAPSNKIPGGKVLSARTRRSGNRAAALLRLAAATVERTDTARRLLQTALGTHWQGLIRDRYGAKDRSAILQCGATRDGLCRSGAFYYEPRYRDHQQSASASQGLRL